MPIIRPVNSEGQESMSMPGAKSPPDTSPTFLSQFFNRINAALAHLHNNGTSDRPAYIGDGGLWAGPTEDGGIKARLTREGSDGAKTDLPFFTALPGPLNAVNFPIGAAIEIDDTHSNDLNNVVEPGLYWYTIADHSPPGMSHATLWVLKHFYGSDAYITQFAISGEGFMALRRNPPADNSEPPGTWGQWQRVSFGGGSGGGGGFISEARFFSGKKPPAVLVLADGTIYSGEDYPEALVQYGDQYGGDGLTTFGVPDLRNQAPMTGGRWMAFIGEDARITGRFYCGVGVWCGKEGLYPGATIII